MSASRAYESVPAPYYDADGITLYLGDCTEVTPWLDADVLVTDPPYGMAHVSGWDDPSRAIRHDDATTTRDLALSMWGEKPAAVFGTWKCPRPVNTRLLVVWDKSLGTGTGMGDLGAAFGHSHEEVYILGSWPRGDRPRLPSVVRTKDGLRSLSGNSGHPTPKSLGLMALFLSAAPHGVVADPFAGSGTTLLAARSLGRRAIGVEIEERYCELIATRLSQGDLFGGAA